MKIKLILILAVIFLISCQKEDQLLSENTGPKNNLELFFEEDGLAYSKIITISDANNNNSLDLIISSGNNQLIDYYLDVYDFNLIVDPNPDYYKNSTLKEPESSNSFTYEEFPEEIVLFEVLDKQFKDNSNCYSIEFKRNVSMLKSYPYPPTTYYVGYKFDKRMKGRMWYFPDDTDNDELILKWGFTTSWIAGWTWDTYWRYIYGYDADDSPVEFLHPLNDCGYYRLGISMYCDDYKYFHLMSF